LANEEIAMSTQGEDKEQLPHERLVEMLELADAIQLDFHRVSGKLYKTVAGYEKDCARLAVLLLALDAHLHEGGALPERWQRYDKGEGQCCLCGGLYHHHGCNPFPLAKEGRCCNACDNLKVTPARIEMSLSGGKKRRKPTDG
jgi:hypothetical protein